MSTKELKEICDALHEANPMMGHRGLRLAAVSYTHLDVYKRQVYIVSGDKEYLKGDVQDSKFTFTDFTPSWEYTVKVVRCV